MSWSRLKGYVVHFVGFLDVVCVDVWRCLLIGCDIHIYMGVSRLSVAIWNYSIEFFN